MPGRGGAGFRCGDGDGGGGWGRGMSGARSWAGWAHPRVRGSVLSHRVGVTMRSSGPEVTRQNRVGKVNGEQSEVIGH